MADSSVKIAEQTLIMVREISEGSKKPHALVIHDAINMAYRFYLEGVNAGIRRATQVVDESFSESKNGKK